MADDHTATDKGYEVQHRDNCMLIFGLVPLRDTATIFAEAGEDDQADIHLASLTGASMVIGHPDDLAILRLRDDLPVSPKRQQEHDDALDQGYSQLFADWLLKGERGLSSDYMAHLVTGIPAAAHPASPRDIDDLKCCFGFIEAVANDLTPLVVLNRMARAPGPWPRLAHHWPLLITDDTVADPHQAQSVLDEAIFGETTTRTRSTQL